MDDDSETASNKIIEMVTELVDYYVDYYIEAVNRNDLHELIEWHLEQRRKRHAEVDKYRKT